MAFKITLPADATSGSFTLTAKAKNTDAIEHPFAASDVKAQLVKLGYKKANVTGPNGGPFVVTGVRDPLTADGTNLGGATKTVTVTNDSAAAGDGKTFKEIRGTDSELIRKYLGGCILIGKEDSEIPEEWGIGEDGNLPDLGALGYVSLGWITKSEGLEFSTETENSDVESWGAPEPTRTDITKNVTSAQFTCQETNKAVLSLYFNVDLSDVKVSPNGDIVFDTPTELETRYFPMIYIAHDGTGKNASYFIRVMPRATVSEVQSLSMNSENESKFGMTIKATVSDKEGYSVRNVLTGPKTKKLAKQMGFAD